MVTIHNSVNTLKTIELVHFKMGVLLKKIKKKIKWVYCIVCKLSIGKVV